jgi:prepilin-type processing-associated H-X9-DG protein
MFGESPEFSDETLLGYLLGGLPDEEIARVSHALQASESLRQRLNDLKVLLEPLQASEEVFEPRADLVGDTLSQVAEQENESKVVRADSPAKELSDRKSFDWSEVPVPTRIAWMDSLVTITAGIIFLSILLPTVWHWREAARQFACAENLRNVGFGLLSYVNFSPSREIPPIDTIGPKAFAGMYAIHLKDRGLLESSRWVHCPSNPSISLQGYIPTSEQFLAATPEQQHVLSYVVGGNYAYNLGVWIDGKYRTPRLDAPVRFAVLGDMWPSNNGVVEEFREPPMLHGDRAANMLYSDGSIRLIRLLSHSDTGFFSPASIDNPFLNREMEQGVGIGIQDACVAPSYWRPEVSVDSRQ